MRITAYMGAMCIAFGALTAHADQLVTRAMLKPDPDGMPNDMIYRGVADFGEGLLLPFIVNETAKGNGSLKLADVELHIVDDHDDSLVYEGGILSVEVANLDGRGRDHLVIHGMAVHTGDKGNERTLEPVVFIYQLDRAQKKLRRVFSKASFNLELGVPATTPAVR